MALALIAAAWLCLKDATHGFQVSPDHLQISAVALILIGAAYIIVHLAGALPRSSRIKAVFLGSAFVLWGSEQFMQPGALVTALDCVVIVIFVVDLSLAITARMKDRHERPIGGALGHPTDAGEDTEIVAGPRKCGE